MQLTGQKAAYSVLFYDSDLSVDFTVRWTDEDNYIIKYIENNTYRCAEIALYKAL